MARDPYRKPASCDRSSVLTLDVRARSVAPGPIPANPNDQSFDLAVVGGGIVGAGIARDAAMRGLKVALVERGDFASGTSGKTSRLVHGGLRYLKRFKIGLVKQAVRERDLLVRRAPGLVKPLAFTIPAYEERGTGQASLKVGLFVYDALSRDKKNTGSTLNLVVMADVGKLVFLAVENDERFAAELGEIVRAVAAVGKVP